MAPLCYRRHRFPPEIIQHAIWLYLRFTMSNRDVEELLADAREPRLPPPRIGHPVGPITILIMDSLGRLVRPA
jgi:hypothetical protein